MTPAGEDDSVDRPLNSAAGLDRRRFVEQCAVGATCFSAAIATPGFAADARPHHYARTLLTDEQGRPLKASGLKAQTNYVFHYPFEATPVFLLDLGTPALPKVLSTKSQADYAWPGGVGKNRSVVAFSAICAHQLVYPTPQVSFISFRKTKAQKGMQDNMIHCCADHSQYDPAKGAQVLSGPAEQPLCAVLLEHDAKADTLTAYATLGGELFEAFFKKYEFKLSLDVGPRAKNAVSGRAAVRELDKFCRNPVQC
jgi:arsenite oxidase small subunit